MCKWKKNSDDLFIKNKKPKIMKFKCNNNYINPIGLIWDNHNFSCAYDSLFTILYNIWNSNHIRWSNFFSNTSIPLYILNEGLNMYKNDIISFEDVRDNVRQYLNKQNHILFPYGSVGMNITDLAFFLCKTSKSIYKTIYECIYCNISNETTTNLSYYIDLQRLDLNITNTDNIVHILQRLFHKCLSRNCDKCNKSLYKNTYCLNTAELLILHLPYSDININMTFELNSNIYELKGIVYYGDNHYTSCIILENKYIWYYDGIQTGRNMLFHEIVSSTSRLNKYNSKNAGLYIYTHK